MNEKLNIQDLVDMLAEKHGMSKKNADSFVKEFFQLIEEALEKDKYVKVKGLGTFKLIDVESRESVNVNTGERFEIQGHTKVSFAPEPTIKDIINKPFAHFETVVLNDNTVLEDTPVDSGNDDDDEIVTRDESVDYDASPISTEEIIETSEEPVETLEQVVETSGQENESLEQPFENIEVVVDVPAKTITEELPEISSTISEEETVTVEEPPVVIPAQKEVTEKTEDIIEEKTEVEKPTAATTDASTMKYFIGIVVFVVVLCAGAVAYLYSPDWFSQFISKPPIEKVADAKADKPTDKTIMTDSIVTKDTVQTVRVDTVRETLANSTKPDNTPKETPKNIAREQEQAVSAPITSKGQKKAVAVPFKPDSVGYTIVGTEGTYTIQEGETLTRVALRFYGTKALWPYIVKHNPGVIKNPDNVPYGTTIKIPKLVKKQ